MTDEFLETVIPEIDQSVEECCVEKPVPTLPDKPKAAKRPRKEPTKRTTPPKYPKGSKEAKERMAYVRSFRNKQPKM